MDSGAPTESFLRGAPPAESYLLGGGGGMPAVSEHFTTINFDAIGGGKDIHHHDALSQFANRY